jgi:hypothetical protein
MDVATAAAAVDDAIKRLKSAHWKEREAIKEQLLAIVRGANEPGEVREQLDNLRKGLALELRWEVEEVLELTAPKPVAPPEAEAAPAPEPEPEPEDPNRPLSMSDVDVVYDDPRGLQLLKTKRGPERWFAVQADPRTGRPQTFELRPEEVAQLRAQLASSPFWMLGAGATAPAAKAPAQKAPGAPAMPASRPPGGPPRRG